MAAQPVSPFDEYLDDPPSSALWPRDRQECSGCAKKSRFFCSACLTFIAKPDAIEIREPQLPIQVDIIVTAEERTRSSGVHLAVVSPKSIQVVPYESEDSRIPAYDRRTTAVIYPSRDSVRWEDMSYEDLRMMRRIVLIDSRWEKTGSVLKHPQLQRLRHVRISHPPDRSRFWRWHASGQGHICTAEATYFVLKEFEHASGRTTQGGQLEDILFLFALIHGRIKDAYEHDPAKAGQQDPTTEAAKTRRRTRTVRLDCLVKSKYRDVEEVRRREGDTAALQEFYRRRRGQSVYDGPASTGDELARQGRKR